MVFRAGGRIGYDVEVVGCEMVMATSREVVDDVYLRIR